MEDKEKLRCGPDKPGPLRYLATENSGCAHLKEEKAGRAKQWRFF